MKAEMLVCVTFYIFIIFIMATILFMYEYIYFSFYLRLYSFLILEVVVLQSGVEV